MPCDGEQKTIGLLEAIERSETYTTDNLITHMEKNGACFAFLAQIRPADEKLDETQAKWAKKYPKDDPTKLWPFDVVTATKLAEIRFPAQPKVKKLKDTCEGLSINPGNTLQDLRPIESDTLMQSRFLAAYEGSVSKRTALNKDVTKGIQTEPAPIPADQLEKWLSE